MLSENPTKEDSKPEKNTNNFDFHMARKKITDFMLKTKLFQLVKKKLLPIMRENNFTKNPQFSLLVISTSPHNPKH